MKIKKIAALCKASGVAALYDRVDSTGEVSQRVSDGRAVYPVTSMPYIEAEHLITLFELSDKQIDKMTIKKTTAPATLDFADAVPMERIANLAPVTLVHNGRELLPYRVETPRGGEVYCVDRALLAPIWAEYHNTELYLRESGDGRPYFAVKNGLMLVGLVMPMRSLDTLAATLGEISCELMNAEADRRLVVLPCKPNAAFYVWRKNDDAPCVSSFDGVVIDADGETSYRTDSFYETINGGPIRVSDIGRTVFLTREDAESALKEAGK